MQDYGMNAPSIAPLAAFAALGLILAAGAAVHSDLTRRQIPHLLCAAIAILALVFAIGEGGWAGLVDFACRLGLAIVIALPLMLLFVIRALGGGDVKLLLALLLWVPASDMPLMLAIVVLTGAAMAAALGLVKRWFCFRPATVPYGLAIVTGALAVLLPRFEGLTATACLLVA